MMARWLIPLCLLTPSAWADESGTPAPTETPAPPAPPVITDSARQDFRQFRRTVFKEGVTSFRSAGRDVFRGLSVAMLAAPAGAVLGLLSSVVVNAAWTTLLVVDFNRRFPHGGDEGILVAWAQYAVASLGMVAFTTPLLAMLGASLADSVGYVAGAAARSEKPWRAAISAPLSTVGPSLSAAFFFGTTMLNASLAFAGGLILGAVGRSPQLAAVGWISAFYVAPAFVLLGALVTPLILGVGKFVVRPTLFMISRMGQDAVYSELDLLGDRKE